MEDRNIPHSFRTADLISGYLQSSLTADQKAELFDWINQSEQNQSLFAKIVNEHNLESYLAELKDYDAEDALAKFRTKPGNIREIAKPGMPFIRIAVAASILFVLSFGVWFYLQKLRVSETEISNTKTDIAPGGNKAILTLADGRKVILDSAANGQIANQSGIVVSKTKNGQLTYTILSSPETDLISYNTIETPKGGQYQVILPDGSQVWLNAASSIRFPTAFNGTERKVDITGEAYFEVSNNPAKPFKVISDHQEVEVLGTHFNIMAYNDETNIVTTLLQGSVRVSNGSRMVIIKPDQDVSLNHTSGIMKVGPADTEAAVAWKNGYFLFEDETIESIMRKVSRWYNVEITYNGNIAQRTFGGAISRFKNASELLDVLQATGSVHFEIQEGRITVMP